MNAKKVPLRQCTGCGQMKDKRTMARVIKTKEEEICLDVTGRKNGRGAYICRSLECFDKALKCHGLERSLKVKIPDEVYEQLREELKDIES